MNTFSLIILIKFSHSIYCNPSFSIKLGGPLLLLLANTLIYLSASSLVFIMITSDTINMEGGKLELAELQETKTCILVHSVSLHPSPLFNKIMASYLIKSKLFFGPQICYKIAIQSLRIILQFQDNLRTKKQIFSLKNEKESHYLNLMMADGNKAHKRRLQKHMIQQQ